jgi:PilZ domain
VANHSGGTNELIDTLRLSDEQWRTLSEKLDRDDPYLTGQRRYRRITYRKLAQIAVAVRQSGGEWAKYVVRSRDLSPGGIGFIHGSYIYLGSECRVILKDCHGRVVCLEGVVKRCELIDGTAHDVGVQFNEEIDVESFVGDGSTHP